MNEMELENLIHQNLSTFYQRRINNLHGIQLKDILQSKNAYLIQAIGTQAASKIVDGLLEKYLLADEGIFTQTQWEELAEYPNFYQKLIFVMNRYSLQHRIEFEHEMANVHNRFLHDFLNNFGNPDGSIDWEKLMRFNSGKEKLTWISKLVPAAITDIPEEDDNDDGE